MRWRDTFRSALDAVSTHRLRSALTMLGILIGIGAVVLTVGLGDGAKADVREQIDALGTNLLVITPGSSTDSTGARGGFGTAVDAHRRRRRRAGIDRRGARHPGRRAGVDGSAFADRTATRTGRRR